MSRQTLVPAPRPAVLPCDHGCTRVQTVTHVGLPLGTVVNLHNACMASGLAPDWPLNQPDATASSAAAQPCIPGSWLATRTPTPRHNHSMLLSLSHLLRKLQPPTRNWQAPAGTSVPATSTPVRKATSSHAHLHPVATTAICSITGGAHLAPSEPQPPAHQWRCCCCCQDRGCC